MVGVTIRYYSQDIVIYIHVSAERVSLCMCDERGSLFNTTELTSYLFQSIATQRALRAHAFFFSLGESAKRVTI